jgi:tRNA (cmo5U34)-methyltransferase
MSVSSPPLQPFNDPKMIAGYVATTPQKVPGLSSLHLMALLLLSEHAPEAANILVLGAGGGLELRTFAEARPSWSFLGVDPSQPMLDLAKDTLGHRVSQVQFLKGYIEDAPIELFDGATCLLTLHFLTEPQRLRTLKALRQRLKPGARLVVAHHTKAEEEDAQVWMTRSIAFASGPQADLLKAAASAKVMAQHLPLLSTQDEERLLRQAGFTNIGLFYAGFSFRGWVAAA